MSGNFFFNSIFLCRPTTTYYSFSIIWNFIFHFIFPVDYTRGERAQCVLTGEFEKKAIPPLVALSNSAHVIAIAVASTVYLFSGTTGILDATISDIFNDNIVTMEFESLGAQLFVAGDRQVRVFHNVTGYKVAMNLAKEKLTNKKISTAIQQRLEMQIEEYQEIIKKHSGDAGTEKALNGN